MEGGGGGGGGMVAGDYTHINLLPLSEKYLRDFGFFLKLKDEYTMFCYVTLRGFMFFSR